MWPALAIMAASALMQSKQNQAKQDQQRKMNLAQSELTRYSPWTGMKGQLDQSYQPGGTEGAFSGGMQGLAMAQSVDDSGMFKKEPTSPTVAPESPPSAIGAPDYSAQLGQQGKSFQNNMAQMQTEQKPSLWNSMGGQPMQGSIFAKNGFYK